MYFFTMRKLRNSLFQSPLHHPEGRQAAEEENASISENILRMPDQRVAVQPIPEDDCPNQPGKRHARE